MPATLFRRSAAVLAAGFLLAHAATGLAITGGVSVEVLLGGTDGTEQQAALAGAVSAVTVPLFIQHALGESVGICTATIVHPRVVLTAAHCVTDGLEVSRHMTVLFERGATRRQALDAAVHPEFFKLMQSRSYRPQSESLNSFIKRTQPSRSNDLALVLLHRQIPETYDVVAPVSAGFRDERGSLRLIAGYGRIDGYQSLHKVSLYFAQLQATSGWMRAISLAATISSWSRVTAMEPV